MYKKAKEILKEILGEDGVYCQMDMAIFEHGVMSRVSEFKRRYRQVEGATSSEVEGFAQQIMGFLIQSLDPREQEAYNELLKFVGSNRQFFKYIMIWGNPSSYTGNTLGPSEDNDSKYLPNNKCGSFFFSRKYEIHIYRLILLELLGWQNVSKRIRGALISLLYLKSEAGQEINVIDLRYLTHGLGLDFMPKQNSDKYDKEQVLNQVTSIDLRELRVIKSFFNLGHNISYINLQNLEEIDVLNYVGWGVKSKRKPYIVLSLHLKLINFSSLPKDQINSFRFHGERYQSSFASVASFLSGEPYVYVVLLGVDKDFVRKKYRPLPEGIKILTRDGGLRQEPEEWTMEKNLAAREGKSFPGRFVDEKITREELEIMENEIRVGEEATKNALKILEDGKSTDCTLPGFKSSN